MVVETKETPQTQDTPLVEPEQSSVDKKVAPKVKTYSEAEHLKAVSDEKAVSGRFKTQLEAITKERDTFKSQIAEATANLEDTKGKLAELEEELETLADGNAPVAEIAKIRRRIEATEAQLRKDWQAKQNVLDELTKTAQGEREQFAGTVAEAQAMQFHADVFEVAEEYEGGDSERLTALCETIREATGKPISRESIQRVAGTLWSKKGTAEDNEPDLLVDSGVTSGGGGFNFKEATPKAKVMEGLKRDSKKPIKVGGK